MTPFVLRQPQSDLDRLDTVLLDAFRALRAALAEGRPAIVVLADADVSAHGDPVGAALAHGLLGLVRALATEGAREGWIVNALSVGEGADPGPWIERLADPHDLRGALVRLGGEHLGRIAP